VTPLRQIVEDGEPTAPSLPLELAKHLRRLERLVVGLTVHSNVALDPDVKGLLKELAEELRQ
jgi:hypothetical protein